MYTGSHQKLTQEDHGQFDLKSRHTCTDVPCCIVFVMSLCGFGVLWSWALAEGNIGKLYHGIDYQGRICGIDEGVQLAPFLYWCMDPQKMSGAGVLSVDARKPVCVESCPGESLEEALAAGSLQNLAQGASMVPACTGIEGAEGAAPYKTQLMMHRYCIPNMTEYKSVSEKLVKDQLGGQDTSSMEALSSIPAAWPVLLGSFLFAILLSYMYLVFLRHCAEVLIWVTLLLVLTGFGLGGMYLWVHAGQLSTKAGQELPPEAMEKELKATQGAAIVCWVLAGVVVFMACCMRSSIQAAAACVEVACEVLFEMPSLLLTPVVKAFVKVGLSVVLMYGFLLTYSTAPISTGSDGLSRHFEHNPEFVQRILFYMLMAFWILAFVSALFQFVVAYAVAEYYYTPYDHDNEKDVGCCSVWDGLFVGLFYHSGSIALGSFLIAVLEVLQKVIEYAQYKNKEAGDNPVIRCALACALCIVACIKEIVETVNRNAYIDIAITSHSFCEAARNAMAMILKLGGTMLILNGCTIVFSIFGCVVVGLGCGGFAYQVSGTGTFAEPASEYNVESPLTVAVAAAVLGMGVAVNFMNVFDMTSDTLLYCYGVDLDSKNGGYTAPPALKELFHSGDFGQS